MGKPTAQRVLVVDDTAIYRKILSRVVSPLPDVAHVETAPRRAIALDKLGRQHFDVVLLDVQMPDMDGMETLEKIREAHPDVAVVMVSAATEKGSETAIRALNLGALDLIEKPHGQTMDENITHLRGDLLSVLRVVETRRLARQIRRRAAGGGGAPSTSVVAEPALTPRRPHLRVVETVPGNFSILAIGSSTGGPEALSQVIPRLPGNLPVPVVIVQHMPPVFTDALAKDLNRKSELDVKEAAEEDAVTRGKVLIAPGGRHLVLRERDDRLEVKLDDGPAENSCKPSVDVLFRSVAETHSRRGVLSLIMTGMGADGRNGVEALKRGRCYSLSQSAETCVVYGMPAAVDEAGLSDESLDLEEIAPRIVELVGRGTER